MHDRLKIIVIGLGHQSIDDHLPAIIDSDTLELFGVVDIDLEKAKQIGTLHNVEYDSSVKSLLAKLPQKPEAGLIAVPHAGYMSIISDLAENKIHIIKEKPFAVSAKDAIEIKKLIKRHNITLQVTLQRRYNPIFRSFQQLVKRIGKVHSIEARYTMNVDRLDEGWRASRLFAGGGALIDLGYHYVDLIVWYFGLPDSVICKLSTGNRHGQIYDVEDTAFVDFSYKEIGPDNERVLGSLVVSRVYPDKEEALVAYGSNGSVSVKRGMITRRDIKGEQIECLERTGAWPSALIDQLEEFATYIKDGSHNGQIETRYLEQVAFVEAAYKSAELHSAQDPREVLEKVLKESTK